MTDPYPQDVRAFSDQPDRDSEQPAEVLEGYVVDLACLRRYPHGKYSDRASRHTTECALMGHCVESGYGVVDGDNRLVALDTRATPHVVAALQNASDRGARVRVERAEADGDMHTTNAALL